MVLVAVQNRRNRYRFLDGVRPKICCLRRGNHCLARAVEDPLSFEGGIGDLNGGGGAGKWIGIRKSDFDGLDEPTGDPSFEGVVSTAKAGLRNWRKKKLLEIGSAEIRVLLLSFSNGD